MWCAQESSRCQGGQDFPYIFPIDPLQHGRAACSNMTVRLSEESTLRVLCQLEQSGLGQGIRGSRSLGSQQGKYLEHPKPLKSMNTKCWWIIWQGTQKRRMECVSRHIGRRQQLEITDNKQTLDPGPWTQKQNDTPGASQVPYNATS